MNFKAFFGFTTAVLFLLALSLCSNAQGVGFSGTIKGSVSDANGAAVPNVTVTITGTETGFRRTFTTDDRGQFLATGLPPARYDIKVEGKGFQPAIQRNMDLLNGQIQTADFGLKVSGVSTDVIVTTEVPLVDTGQSQQANTIEERYIRDLPINRRDYLTYTLLAPGVSDSTRVASDQDFRVKQTPQSGLSFYGSNGRGNNVTVDGGETNDDSGGVRGSLSQDAVSEFQINRSNYTAELGGASGASINIVSKSGTNTLHGSAFGYFRNQAMDARNPFSFNQALAPGQTFNPASGDLVGTPVKDKLSRGQFGGSAGFAIKPDKTFLFLAAEGLVQNAQNSVPLLTSTQIFRPDKTQTPIINGLAALGATPVPCLTGQPALPAATCAGILTNIFTINPATSPRNAYIVNQFEANGGIFPYPTRDYQASGRIDTRMGDNNQFFFRYNYVKDNESNPDVQSLTGFSRGSSVNAFYHTAEGAWFHEFNPTISNEARVQFSYTDFRVTPNAFGQVGLDIPGFGNLGNQIFIPNFSVLRRYEFADNVTVVHGGHIFKFGGMELIRGNNTESHTFFPGRFVFGSLPGGLVSPCLQVPAACGLTGVNASAINSLQAVSLGLPQFYQQGFGSPNYAKDRPFTAFFGQDAWNIRRNFTLSFGVRYELDSQYGNLRTDNNNFAPRISFSWDPFNDHKTVIRGGYGIFYSQVYAQIPNVVQSLGDVNGNRQIVNFLVPLTGQPGNPALTSAAIFQTLFPQGKVQCNTPQPGNFACITPADLAQFGIAVTHTGPLPPLTVLFTGQSDYQNPYSQQMEIGLEREVVKGLSLSASYIHVHTVHLPVAIDTNLLPAPLAPAGPAGIPIRQWGSSVCTTPATSIQCFVNPLILQNNQYSSIGSAFYDGFLFEFKGRLSNWASLFGSYTLSKAIDDVTDFNSDYSPMDQTNFRAERSLSDFDQRHKIVVAAVLQTPQTSRDSSAVEKFLAGFQLAPIVRYNSSHPFNLLAGTNVNNDRHSTNDRPPGAGRNTGIGPDYFDVDLRLSRGFNLAEHTKLEVLAEGFNLFNRTNFGSVNNVVGVIAGPFNLQPNPNASPSQPLGYTSALPKRQFQLGARLVF